MSEEKDHVQRTIETYDTIAKDYHVKATEEIRAECEMSMINFKALLDKVSHGEDASVLVVGCGEGRDSRFMSKELGLEVMSIDLSKEMLKIAEAEDPMGIYIEMDIRNLGSDRPPTSFDGIYAQNCLYHLREIEFLQFIKDASELLDADGILYLTMKVADTFEEKVVPAPADFPHLKGERFYTIYTAERLLGPLSQYFDLISLRDIKPPELEESLEMYWRKK